MSNDDNKKTNMDKYIEENLGSNEKQKKECEKNLKVSSVLTIEFLKEMDIAIINGTIVPDIHEQCYCGNLVTRGVSLCHEQCYCGNLVTRGVSLCH
jgi:hypothetical protein